MTIAAVGAVALGHVGEAAALAFLFSIAEALEDPAMDRARHGLRALLSLIPETARLSKLTGEVTVPASQVQAYDIVVVGAGERVATDGVMVRGRSSVDTSAVTGESIPVEVGPADAVPSGAVNGAGTLHIEATADVVLFPLALFGVPGLAEVVLVHEEAARATPLALEACPRSHNRPSASFAVLLNCATHR
jgi:cation-transporting ATPase G